MDASPQEVGRAVTRLQWRHHREANKRLARLGLSLAQWDVLRHLDAHPDASLHDLAMLTFQTDQSMGALAGRMIDRGFLERRNTTGRVVKHRLTARGDLARREGSDAVDDVMATSIGRLRTPDLATLHRLLLAAAGDDGTRRWRRDTTLQPSV